MDIGSYTEKIPVDEKIIKEKAMRIYKRLEELDPISSIKQVTFNASGGFLTWFLKRHAHNLIKN